MKIKRFNEDLVNYPDTVKEEIIKYGWNGKGKVKYHIAMPSDGAPQNMSSFATLEKAVNYINNSTWDNDWEKYCIFESSVRAIPQEEIEDRKSVV